MDNILFILTDQQRADSLGVVNGWSATPNLDALAGAGTLFTDCFTTSPVCVPARFSLASGLYPHNLGVQANRIVTYPAWLETWFGRLRRNGYRTSMFGKNHLHPDGGDLRASTGLLNRLGFDEVDEVGGPRALQTCTANLTDLWDRHGVRRAYRDDVAERLRTTPWLVRPTPVGLDLYYDTYVARSAARYLREYDKPEPWCCYVGFPGPHEPWDTPAPWATAYDPAAMPPPRDAPRSLAERPSGDLDARIGRRPPLSAVEIAALRADYAGEVSLIDHLVGELVQAVRDRGEWDRTVVVFTSDHGEMNGDAGLLYKKVFLDGAARVPLIVRDPGSPPGVVDRPVELMDVGATVLDLAGMADAGAFRMGVSLAAAVRGGVAGPPRTDALCEHDGEVMLATADWKIALNAAGETYLLFDRSADESVNLAGAGEFADVQRDLEARLLQRLVRTSSRTPVFGAPPPSRTVASLTRRLLGKGPRSWARLGRRGVPGAGPPAPAGEGGAEP
ncbi:MAG TPA: sulfatase-like hydrolase/transferase [Acidimicrobiales bacterium]|nr:sulfatase-like hydrolase/transferase [Acidimicrobiales bacterium]